MLLEMKQLSTGLQNALEDLASEVSASGENQRSLQKSVASLERLVGAGMQSDAALTRKLAEAAEALADAADRSLAGAETASQAGTIWRPTPCMASSISPPRSQADRRGSNMRWPSRPKPMPNWPIRSAPEWAGSAHLLAALAISRWRLSQLREEFNRMSQLAEEQNMTLSRLLSEQNTMASSLSDVARDLGAAGVSTSLRQREMNDELGSLVRRLDALAAHADAHRRRWRCRLDPGRRRRMPKKSQPPVRARATGRAGAASPVALCLPPLAKVY